MAKRRYRTGIKKGAATGRMAGISQAYRQKRRYDALRYRRQPVIVYQQKGEFKGMDTEMNLAAGAVLATTNTNGSSFVVNLIRTGNASYNRVGRKIKAKTLRIFGRVSCDHILVTTAEALLGNILRMVVVWDQQPSGVLPAFDDIFGHTEQDGTESTDFLDPRKYDNMDRFRVLKDCRYDSNSSAIEGSAGTANITMQYNIDEYINLRVGETVYSGESTPMTIADISSGAIYVYFRSFLNTGTGSEWSTSLTARLRYQD